MAIYIYQQSVFSFLYFVFYSSFVPFPQASTAEIFSNLLVVCLYPSLLHSIVYSWISIFQEIFWGSVNKVDWMSLCPKATKPIKKSLSLSWTNSAKNWHFCKMWQICQPDIKKAVSHHSSFLYLPGLQEKKTPLQTYVLSSRSTQFANSKQHQYYINIFQHNKEKTYGNNRCIQNQTV